MRGSSTRTRPDGRRESGAAAVELVLVAPGLLLLIFFGVQAALYFYGRVVAEQAAREGVSLLRLAQNADRADETRGPVADSVTAYARNVGRETLLAPTAETAYDEDGGVVSVTVTGQVISLVPGLDLTVTQRVTGQIERFEGDDRPRP
ncbi:MAG TPA: TadE/TadG family type IV pilus assembly protein [Mycobacteriales bacterium]|nr:TadE/TadG family type IV pilus assembly protein [Mycobacteriales bacterium]